MDQMESLNQFLTISQIDIKTEEAIFECNSDLELYKCEKCGFECCFKVHLKQHINRIHNGLEADQNLNFFLEGYRCRKCFFQTHSVLIRRSHRCGAKQKKMRHLRETLHECEHCHSKFPMRWHLNRHILSRHTAPEDINWLKCEHCDFVTKLDSYLQKHMKLKHVEPGKSQWFKCEHCSAKFATVNYLNRHTSRKHSAPEDVRWLLCEHCAFKTRYGSSLKTHVIVKHTSPEDAVWFECEHCRQYRTKAKGDLRQHVKRKHVNPKKTKWWFQCGECSVKAATKILLDRHTMRVHRSSDEVNIAKL